MCNLTHIEEINLTFKTAIKTVFFYTKLIFTI